MAGYRGKDLAYFKFGAATLTKTKGDLTINIANGEIDLRDDGSAGYNEALMGDQTVTISGRLNMGGPCSGRYRTQANIQA